MTTGAGPSRGPIKALVTVTFLAMITMNALANALPLNGRNTGSLIEQRRRIGDGTSPSLLNPTGSAFNNMSTGQSSPTPGSLNDGSIYSLTLHLMSRGGATSFGNTSSNTTGGGIVLSGPGIQAITFSNPDAPASALAGGGIGEDRDPLTHGERLSAGYGTSLRRTRLLRSAESRRFGTQAWSHARRTTDRIIER